MTRTSPTPPQADRASPAAARPELRTPGLRMPEIDSLLARLAGRITQKIWLYGLGSVACATIAWLAFAFVADWALHAPHAVRWMHLGFLAAIPGFVLWRTLVVPLGKRPGRDGLALLIERAHPQLGQMLVSAVQLAERPNGSPELVAKAVAQAEARARELRIEPVLDPRAPHRRALLGAAGILVAGFWAQANPTYARIFFERLVGRDTPWPQRTYLTLSIPLDSTRAKIEIYPDRIDVRAARGTDVPVVVRADGVLPEEVLLHFEGGRALGLTPSGGSTFRALLRSVQTDLEFHAEGGDDQSGLPVVHVTVLEPPDITGLAVRVRPPAYTGLGEELYESRDVQVLAGSHLAISVLTDPPDAEGRVQLLPADEFRDLVPMPFPSADAESAPLEGLGFELDPLDSVRYRFELRDGSGLSNPDPGLFAIQVVPDRRPEVTVVAPGRSEVDTTLRGLVPLVVRAEDDFGVQSIEWALRVVGASLGESATGAATPIAGAVLEPRPLAQRADLAPGEDSGRRAWVAGGRIEIGSLTSEELAHGVQLELDVLARDNRPELGIELDGDGQASGDGVGQASGDGVGHASKVRIRIVTEEELLRRVQDRLVRVRALVSELEEQNRKRSQQTSELLATLESDDLGGIGESELLAALTGARRVQGDAKSLTRELAAVAETVLYARLDEKADGLLDHLDEAVTEITDKQFHPEVWLDLAAAWKAGRLGTPAFAGQLVGLVDLALELSESDASGAAGALDRALEAAEIGDVHAALTEAAAHQTAAQTHIEDLLERLAEWDNFQSILTLTRDILNRQKALEERTRRMARDK